MIVSLATLALAIAGARRIDVQWVGKAGTFFVMFALPGFLSSTSSSPGTERDVFEVLTWTVTIVGLVLSYYAAARSPTSPLRAAARRARAERPWQRSSARRPAMEACATMKAVILAGGEGTRLRPLTSNQPKPMMPLVNRPMIEHIVALLAQHGFDDIVVTVAFLANQIRDYFGDGSEFGVRMRYATEDTPLGTAGSVRNAVGRARRDVPGDLRRRAHRHRPERVRRRPPVERHARVDRAQAGREPAGVRHRDHAGPTGPSSASSRSRPGDRCSPTRSTPGSTSSSPRCSTSSRPSQVVDFAGDVFPAALAKGLTLHGHVADGYWEDIGTTDAYLRAHTDVLDGRVEVEIAGFEMGDGIWLGEGAEIDPAAPSSKGRS